jgi:phage FluMu protein gp41
MLRTEHEFSLPIGYQDAEGTLHREGVMRLATAADEILPLKDPRVVKNPAYLVVILLSRVVTRLGSVSPITPKVVEDLYAKDLAYLQDRYNEINRLEARRDDAVCPECQHEFAVEAAAGEGGSSATPWTSSAGR